VTIAPGFFAALPCLLRDLRRAELASFHALRFSTWGKLHDSDRLPVRLSSFSTSPPWSAVHVAREHAFDARDWRSFAYGGTHALLLQRKTVSALLAHVLARGAMGTDVALRERAADDPAAFRSLVVVSPLVSLGSQQYSGWRSTLPVHNVTG
jgi:hypothetical protein